MSETKEVAELALKADKNAPAMQLSISDGREFILHRSDFKLEQITALNAADVNKPKIVTQAVEMQDSNSFIEYVNRFKNDDSVIFADMTSSTVLGVVDYHQMPSANRPNNEGSALKTYRDPVAELGVHRVRFPVPHSIEWKTWMGANGKLLSHKTFATFLEENAIDILPLPQVRATSAAEAEAPQTLLELTRSLQVTQKVSFNSSARHGDYDRIEFQKESDATAKGAVTLPTGFDIRIPVYFGEPAISLHCFIRKEIDEGVLKIGFVVNRAENERQMEFLRIVAVIGGSTALTTLSGKPSA